MRFLLDENLPRQMAEVLRDQGHDLIEVADPPLRGSEDVLIWQKAAQEGRILITETSIFPFREPRPRPQV
ncbi:MAG: DUF5615 family PIN-like protein [Chloroflexi bacterium]|nr:DUF5615 family PIN-like protein [Chloroflexota bacterium]